MSAIERYDLLEHGVLRFLTAGSVDDGKSTLIGRLLYDSKSILADQLAAIEKQSKNKENGEIDLAILTDGLRAEREQGITIDVAYKYFSTPKRKFIIADAPGHIQYTRNMVTGESIVDPSANMKWYKGETLLHLLENVKLENDINLTDARFPVQYVIRPQTGDLHDYRGYAGKLTSGILKTGDKISVLPAGHKST